MDQNTLYFFAGAATAGLMGGGFLYFDYRRAMNFIREEMIPITQFDYTPQGDLKMETANFPDKNIAKIILGRFKVTGPFTSKTKEKLCDLLI